MSDAMTHTHGAPPPVPPPTDVPSARLLLTLGGAGALAGLFIVLAFTWTQPKIEAHRAATLQTSIAEVLQHPARWDTLYLVGGALTATLPAGADAAKHEKVYEGFTEDGRRVGVAISAGEPGFSDVISLLFGYDPSTRTLLAMKVLGHKETPGLGDKIEKDSSFTSSFPGNVVPLVGVKDRTGTTPGEVDMITGATISSRTVIKAINNAIAKWQPLLEARTAGAKP